MFNIAKALLMPTLWPHWLVNRLAFFSPQVHHRPPQTADAPTGERPACPLTIQVALLPGWPTGAHVQVIGALDRFTYEALIQTATTLFGRGHRHLLLDLRRTTQIEFSGLFALLNIALLYSGQPMTDPAGGWAAVRRATEAVTPATGQQVKLLATPAIAQTIHNISYCNFFELYPDPETAITTFPA